MGGVEGVRVSGLDGGCQGGLVCQGGMEGVRVGRGC